MALYVVATPIGNLEDITLRALRVLKEVDLIASEDTRHTKKLLAHYGISTAQTSCHEHNERHKAARLVERMKEGASVALVTDAGTPGISDPGYRLVSLAVASGIEVVPVPGASAVVSALSVSALPIDEFTFKGFVPNAKGRREKFIHSLRGEARTYVVYESPRRLRATLEVMDELLPKARLVVVRELTKMHEETMRGTPAECLAHLGGREPRGEVTVVIRVDESTGEGAGEDGPTVEEELQRLLDGGCSVRDAAAVVAERFGLTRRAAYAAALTLRGRHGRTGG